MDKKIRVLIVGLGRMGRNHLRAVLENPEFELAGIVDPVAAPGDSGVPCYRHLNFSIPRPDAAIVATPSHMHGEAMSVLASRSIPMLIEKPIGLSTSAALSLGAFSRFVVVGHVERFNPAVQELRASLSDLGDITSVSAVRIGGERLEDAEKRGGVAFDLAVHDLDICRWLFGKLRVDFASCTTDTASMRLLSQSGIDIAVAAGWGGGEKSRSLTLSGTRTVEIEYQKRTLTIDGKPVPVRQHEPLAAQLEAFARFVRGQGRGDLCSPEDAYAVVRLAEHAVNAHGFF